MKLQLSTAFNYVNIQKPYVFINGHPVDTRNPKYKKFKKWYEQGRLICFGCFKEPSFFELAPAKSAGCIHEGTGRRKYFLKLMSDDNMEFGLDHWYPRWFLRERKISFYHNLVPMCKKCNNEKGAKMPINGIYKNTFYEPIKRTFKTENNATIYLFNNPDPIFNINGECNENVNYG